MLWYLCAYCWLNFGVLSLVGLCLYTFVQVARTFVHIAFYCYVVVQIFYHYRGSGRLQEDWGMLLLFPWSIKLANIAFIYLYNEEHDRTPHLAVTLYQCHLHTNLIYIKNLYIFWSTYKHLNSHKAHKFFNRSNRSSKSLSSSQKVLYPLYRHLIGHYY